MESITLSDSTPDVGQVISVDVTVRNQGTENAGPFDVHVWEDGPPVHCDGHNYQDVTGLAAGASTTLTFSNISYGSSGTKTFSAYADACETIAESDDGNNTRSTTVGGGPSTDSCSDATPVGNGTFTGTSVGAGTDGDACCVDFEGADVWWRYTAPTSGTASVDTCGSDFDTVLSAFAACGGSELDCDDDGGASCGWRLSQISFYVAAGTSYLIRVAGYGGSTGNITLNISSTRCADGDSDGVCDAVDNCPGTLAGEAVNAVGCACGQISYADGDECTTDTCDAGVCRHTRMDCCPLCGVGPSAAMMFMFAGLFAMKARRRRFGLSHGASLCRPWKKRHNHDGIDIE